ncbi:hypothetical protein [Streptomyces sp. RKAG293]|uniref:hypothetical protein n=1 Tax=Streptomyces sp. RKAG293 TaxID=2893403 RepID=UPI002034299F|nr:hypothetical protein [Streptomyces sp. RKAG293]MCM2419068.1 hypothetical protein [Streptomyces sp. RKAG293]
MTLRAKAAIVFSALSLLALMPGIAHAGGGGGIGNVGGGTTDPGKGTIAAAVGVQYNKGHNGSGDGAGPLTPVGTWAPPACWYQPMYTPDQLKASSEGVWSQPSVGYMWVNAQRDRYVDGHPYTNFNADKAGKGFWWAGYADPSRYADPKAFSCTDEPFWVDKGEPAPAGHPNAVTPAILAQLAYAQILIPQGAATMNPAGNQTVNLPTWVWLNGKQFHPVSVTAYLPDYGISATTTATPVSMHIDPGTPDATVYPGSGNCPLDANGHVGTPYAAGATGNPPCGVTYLRSTNSTGSYHLKATVTWHISWTGTGQANPKDLPEGTFGTPQDVTVREVQTINR